MKDPIKSMKSQTYNSEKLFGNHISNKGVVSRIYKEVLNLTVRDKPIRKGAKDTKNQFTEENIQMATKHKKRCSVSLAIR